MQIEESVMKHINKYSNSLVLLKVIALLTPPLFPVPKLVELLKRV